MAGTEKKGNRPSRSVYQITESGRSEFIRLLKEVWNEPERQYFAIDIGVAFMNALPVAEVKGYLRKQVAQMEANLQYLDSHQQEQMSQADIPGSAALIFEHSRAHLNAELSWMKEILEKIEQGKLF